jgi:hypothetical protein
MLKLLPDVVYPVTSKTFDPLMTGLVQLNTIDAGLSEPEQRALGIYLHAIDIYVKTKGAIDYRGIDGHQRLIQDAFNFCGTGNPAATRHGDLAAAHLCIDWHDTMVRSIQTGLPLLPNDTATLLLDSRDLRGLAPMEEKRVGLFLDYLGKKSAKGLT